MEGPLRMVNAQRTPLTITRMKPMPMYHNRERDGMGRIGAEKNEACFKAPDGSGLEGKAGEASIEWRRRDDGMIEVTSVNGVPLGGGEKPRKAMESDTDSGDDMAMAQAGTGPGYPSN